jgi:DNA gyrase subunit A
VSENGYGKRSMLEDYRVTSRGGKGVKTINITEKTGLLIAIDKVTNDDDLMIINKSGITIRVKGETVPVASRATQGVKLIDLGKRKDSIASIAVVPKSDEEDENTEGAENGAEGAESGNVQTATENATNESGVETTSTPAPENTENS